MPPFNLPIPEARNVIDPFEYDVFISFASADEPVVRPLWQELSSNGLRVFWSDATLKKEVGNSWFDIIESSLVKSRHMLLVCSENSMSSTWVKREYRAFFDHCSSQGNRRLIPVLTRGFKAADLPIFLRELQVGKIDDPAFIRDIIGILGGVNIEQLQRENQALKERVGSLLEENTSLRGTMAEYQSIREQAASLIKENSELRDQLKNKQMELSMAGVHSRQAPPERPGSLSDRQENQELSVRVMEQYKFLLRENAKLKEQVNSLLARQAESTEGKQTGGESLSMLTIQRSLQAAVNRYSASGNQEISSSPVKDPIVYVSNLSPQTSDADLKNFFSEAGIVLQAKIVTDRLTGTSLGYGLVFMFSAEEAMRAILSLNGRELHGCRIVIDTRPPSE